MIAPDKWLQCKKTLKEHGENDDGNHAARRLLHGKQLARKRLLSPLASWYVTDILKDAQVYAAFASDGIDNSESAGAIVDLGTKKKLQGATVSLDEHKASCDTNVVFEKTGDLIMTGVVEANVSDLALLITPRHE